jgi:hypothetical protein
MSSTQLGGWQSDIFPGECFQQKIQHPNMGKDKKQCPSCDVTLCVDNISWCVIPRKMHLTVYLIFRNTES